jgi:soluble cytochrome b562
MEKIGRAFRVLGREINDATKNEDALKQVGIIRVNAEAAAKLKPAKLADVPADQQAKFLADYAEQMKSFLKDVDSLESALKAGDNATAAKLAEQLKKDRNAGHKEFQKKKDEM